MSSLYELLMVRSHVKLDDAVFLIQLLDIYILKLMSSSNIEQSIHILCNCLHHDTELLQHYISEYLTRKWERQNRKLLKLVVESDFFLTIFASCFKWKILNNHWEQQFKYVIDELVETVNRVIKGDEKLIVIKLLGKNINTWLQIIKLMIDNNLKINLQVSDIFRNLILKIRLLTTS